MDKNTASIAFLIAFLLTALAVYKRYHSFGGAHEFSLVFGRPLLSPKLVLFSVSSAAVLVAPLNYKVGEKAYRDISGYYERMRDREAFFKSLKENPVTTIAFSDAARTSDHLGLPYSLAVALRAFAKKTLCLSGTTFCIILILTFTLLWKTYN